MQQPTINIGMIGHVSNGKSTLTKMLSGVSTQKHSKEKSMNLTIKLGYANTRICKCNTCDGPKRYQGFGDNVEIKCRICGGDMTIERYISFVDCPGHNSLTPTMLNGTSVMDAVIVVESAANEIIPSLQTQEHLKALKDIPILFACMNKLDLVDKDEAIRKIAQLKKVISAPIIPISANFGFNIDIVCHYLSQINIPERNPIDKCQMMIVRSFDINKPGVKIKELKGGVIGGSIVKGSVSIGDKITIYPGVIIKDDGWKYKPINSTVVSIYSEKTPLEKAVPGGLIAVGLSSDPALTARDRCVGQCLTVGVETHDVYDTIKLSYELSIQMVKNDNIMINYNSCNITGQIAKIKPKYIIIKLENRPLYMTDNKSVIFLVDGKIVGNGIIIDGLPATKI